MQKRGIIFTVAVISCIRIILPELRISNHHDFFFRFTSQKSIVYKLVKDFPIRNIYAQFVGPCGTDHILPESLQKEGILNFNALIETNLRILFVGDSVGMQFSHTFQESSHPIDRNVLRYSKGLHETTHIVLTKDGGRISGLRVNGLPLESLVDQVGLMPPLRVSIFLLNCVRIISHGEYFVH